MADQQVVRAIAFFYQGAAGGSRVSEVRLSILNDLDDPLRSIAAVLRDVAVRVGDRRTLLPMRVGILRHAAERRTLRGGHVPGCGLRLPPVPLGVQAGGQIAFGIALELFDGAIAVSCLDQPPGSVVLFANPQWR